MKPLINFSSYNQESLINGINNLRMFLLEDKPHIKEYYKIRKIHSEIFNAMIQYYDNDKFKRQISADIDSDTKSELLELLESNFDLETHTGLHSYYDMLVYKHASYMNCITEDFIKNNHYKRPEKKEFLQSMLDSKPGLFEVTGIDMKEGYAYIKDVFTGAEYKIIDIGLSGNQNNDRHYIYTRIITYHDISIGTGLNFIFKKTDNFIRNHIQQHRKDFSLNGEFPRFIQLYNRYSQDPDKVRTILNEF